MEIENNTNGKIEGQYAGDNGVPSTKKGVNSQQCEKAIASKQEVIKKLGFNKKQAQRFETMASNKDVVEQVKAEARENEDIPTRSRVLQLVKDKSKEENESENLQKQFNEERDKAHSAYCRINDAIYKPISVEITEENVGYWMEDMTLQEMEEEEKNIDEAIHNLNEIKRIMQKNKGIRRIK